MLRTGWSLTKATINGYIDDGAMSKGAAIAYYTVVSLAPVLVILVAIVGLIYGQEAARGAVVGQLQGMMGRVGAEAVQGMIAGARSTKSGLIATALGILTLLVTASGVFGEMQSALNAIWRAEPRGTTVSRLVRARAASLGLVATLAFLMVVSLAASTAITALAGELTRYLPDVDLLLRLVNFVISFALLTALFAAIYKVLPDKRVDWSDVGTGAAVTSLLFTLGKTLIGLYIGSSNIASSYGAAGALVVVLLWIYYSAQIFLLGAEFTRAYAERHGSHSAEAAASPAI